MNLAAIYMTVIMANFATGWFIYALWRLKENEQDWRAIGIVLFVLLTVGVAALAAREQSQELTAAQAHSER